MPRKRVKSKRAGWTRDHIRQLLDGFDYIGRAFGNGSSCDTKAMRGAWFELRDRLLTTFIANHPGERPWAFWNFEALEPRRKIGMKSAPYIGAEYESDVAFLDRIDQLTPAERRSLKLPRATSRTEVANA
jgi:hypothetical protein